MEDVIMRNVESLDGSMNDDKCDTPKRSHVDNIKETLEENPQRSYSKDLLMKLKNHPQSQEKPISFEIVDYVSKNGMWDPEHWHSRTAKDTKRPTSGSISGSNGKDEQQDKKRGKDEGDEFCFTPQRRSFVSGCHVAPSARRQEPEPAPLPPVVDGRDAALASRRVGSGRLTGRDAEPLAPPNAKDPRDRREPLRVGGQRERTFERSEPPRNDRNDRNDRGDRNERAYNNNGRPDPRDSKGLDKDRRNYERSGYDRDYGRGGNRYQGRKMEDDTPEWFHGGPASVHDTIELRGFDEEKDKAKSIKATSKKERPGVGGKKGEEPMANGSSRPGSGLSDRKGENQSSGTTEKRKSPTPEDKIGFNIDDILKMDSDGLNGLGLSGPAETEEISRGSKASRWFGKTSSDQSEPSKTAKEVSSAVDSKEDAARSLLEMMQKGSSGSHTIEHKKVVTAEELERSAGKFNHHKERSRNADEGMDVFNKLLAQVQDSSEKPHAVMSNAPTEQDILANLLGNKMKMEPTHSHPNHHNSGQMQHTNQPPQQDALTKFLQQNNQMHHQNQQQPNSQMFHQNQQQHVNHMMQQQHLHHPPQHNFQQMPGEQQHPDVQALMRDVANGFLNQHPQAINQLHMMALQQQQQQQQMQQQHQQQQQQHQQQRPPLNGSPQQPANKQPASSSPLSFTPTAVMRKMTADKDKIKSSSMDKADEPGASSPPASSSNATSNRLTGRTASQVQGASRVSNQLGMSDGPMAQQQQLLTGRPLVKGQESGLPFQQGQPIGNRPPFVGSHASNAAITGVAVKMLEQQQQHQLLAAAVAASNQTQHLKQLQQQQLLLQQQQQQQQRTSPLQQSLMAFAGLQSSLGMQQQQQNRGIPPNVPVGNRTHFRPIHPQPMIPPVSGYSPFMGNQPVQNRPPSGMPSSNQFMGMPPAANMRGQAQGMNALAALHQQYSGNRSPNMIQGGNPLSRWFPPEILSQAGGQMPLPPMPNQKIMSLEELERMHTSPMSH